MKNKIVLGVVLAGLLMAACGGGDPAVISADQGGDRPFVPPAEEPLDAPETDGGTCIDMKAASAARESEDRHVALIQEAWDAGDGVQAGEYMTLTSKDFNVITDAFEASPTASTLATAVSYGYEAAGLYMGQAQVQFDTGNKADGNELMQTVNESLSGAFSKNVELTEYIRTTDLGGAYLCDPIIDNGAFRLAPAEVNLTGGK